MRRWLFILGALCLGAAMVALWHQHTRDDVLFSGLEDQLDFVRQVEIVSPQGPIVLDQASDGSWKISSAADVKARKENIRLFLLAIARAEKAEEKTADPSRWPEIGLGPAEQRVVLRDGQAKILADMRLGKILRRSHEDNTALYYARDGKGGPAYLLSPLPELSKDAAGWADISIPAIAPETIRRFTLTAADLSNVTLAKASSDSRAQLTGKTAAETANEARIEETFASLRAIEPLDIREARHINWFNAHTIYVETATGLTVSGQIVSRNGEAWLRLNGSARAGSAAAVQNQAQELNSLRALALRIAPEKAALMMRRRTDFILPPG